MTSLPPLTSAESADPMTPRKAFRSTDEAMLGGVAAGLASHLGLPVMWVRAGFIIAAAFGGFGIATYGLLWMFLPAQPHFGDEAPGLAAATRQGKRPRGERSLSDYGPLVAMGAIALGVLVLVSVATNQVFSIWPLVLAAGGVAFLWRQADEAQRERWRDSSGRIDPLRAVFGAGGWASYVRVIAGLTLLVGAIALFSLNGGDWSGAATAGVAALLGIIGLAFIVGPWIFRLSSDLSEERAERVRSQERADVAAHLHDSVLQTLALIQKSADDPTRVAQLARGQERDLRSWLYAASGADPTRLAAALQQVASEVEVSHGVPVEVVCVGDRPLPESAQPLVLATREAVVNAAKHSGAAKVDVYAEVTLTQTEVFVRDRGAGFEMAAIAPDRHGVTGSIIDRMRRHGGSASVRSTPGEGTEVRLTLPNDAASKPTEETS
jgi:signal transduction histidine kinase/phage shock protein PspC (stress-responsive transcriptional regulator)